MRMKKHIIWGLGSVIVLLAVIVLVQNFFGSKVVYTDEGYDGFGYEEVADVAAESRGTVFSLSSSKSAQPAAAPSPGSADVAQDDRLIIKTGHLSVVVEDVVDTIGEVSRFAQANGGFVVSSNVSEFGLAPTGSVVVRIPSALFDVGILQVKSMGEMKSESVTGRDVTEEFVDLEAQLSNLRATETQFLEIMKRAFKIEDILAVQRELTNVRSRIERTEGQMKYLRESADLSTITVNLSTDPDLLPVVDDGNAWKPWAVVKNAVRSMIEALQIVFAGVTWLIIYIPVMILYTLGAWLVYWVGKKLWKRFRPR